MADYDTIFRAYQAFLPRLGRNYPTTPETQEMYRRVFYAGWRASAAVSRWEHLKRALGWQTTD